VSNSPPTIYIVTCYYNPNGYETKRRNFDLFVAGLRHLSQYLIVIECALGGRDFELPVSSMTLRVRGANILWQKERMLNIAIRSLPPHCTKVVWIDCDLIFEDLKWFDLTEALLDEMPVVQPFSEVVRLPKGHLAFQEEGPRYWSFAAVRNEFRECIFGGDYERHGHTGFGWAARRDWLDRHGLYDCCLTGSGDHLMAHAMCGDLDSHCVRQTVGYRSPYSTHFRRWAEGVYQDVQGSVGVVPGRIYHLWHGDLADRHYYLRNLQLLGFGFDPAQDIRLGTEGAWEWATQKPDLHAWARAFFTWRNEDGAFNFVSTRNGRRSLKDC
jgi:hypothetical protein